MGSRGPKSKWAGTRFVHTSQDLTPGPVQQFPQFRCPIYVFPSLFSKYNMFYPGFETEDIEEMEENEDMASSMSSISSVSSVSI